MMQSEPQNDGRQSSQQGFTILESLVAILVVGILLIAISPVIVLSIGVRLQAKRVDAATRAARLYIDGVKSGEIAPPEHTVELESGTPSVTNSLTPQPPIPEHSAVQLAPPSDIAPIKIPLPTACTVWIAMTPIVNALQIVTKT